ncbi:MAG: hypothetical protein KOO62_08895 [candidate division Zixibacteria bacterium]|nr:hypothetical protein [candidate division Zixibacteria bacterium]
MSQIEVLRSLEGVLESFLESAIRLKQDRLDVLNGLNNLDDIALSSAEGFEITDRLGQWFAGHNQWLEESTLRSGDSNRIGELLSNIGAQLNVNEQSSPAARKISSEISRWNRHDGKSPSKSGQEHRKIVLKRGAEEADQPLDESIAAFDQALVHCRILLQRVGQNRKHLLSAIDDSLKMASIQGNKDALLLSAFAIYYLKQSGYRTEPYVKRLKEAERRLRGEQADA